MSQWPHNDRVNERRADEFDCRLYNLIMAAVTHAIDPSMQGYKEGWEKVAHALRSVRPVVREMMSEKDRCEKTG